MKYKESTINEICQTIVLFFFFFFTFAFHPQCLNPSVEIQSVCAVNSLKISQLSDSSSVQMALLNVFFFFFVFLRKCCKHVLISCGCISI